MPVNVEGRSPGRRTATLWSRWSQTSCNRPTCCSFSLWRSSCSARSGCPKSPARWATACETSAPRSAASTTISAWHLLTTISWPTTMNQIGPPTLLRALRRAAQWRPDRRGRRLRNRRPRQANPRPRRPRAQSRCRQAHSRRTRAQSRRRRAHPRPPNPGTHPPRSNRCQTRRPPLLTTHRDPRPPERDRGRRWPAAARSAPQPRLRRAAGNARSGARSARGRADHRR